MAKRIGWRRALELARWKEPMLKRRACGLAVDDRDPDLATYDREDLRYLATEGYAYNDSDDE